jgi:3-oxoacyl-[acyl-carrier-protein] synthase II
MDIFIHYGMAAAIQAIKDAGIDDVTHFDAERIGVNIGSGIGGLPMIENTDTAYHAGGPRKISPFFHSQHDYQHDRRQPIHHVWL